MEWRFEQLRQIGSGFLKKASEVTGISSSPREIPSLIIDTEEQDRDHAALLRAVMRAIVVVSTVHDTQTGRTYKVCRHLELIEEKTS